jgi:hypothetical protein
MRRLLLIVITLVCLTVPALAEEPTLTMKAGADYRATLVWSNPQTGTPINLTGNSYAAQFRSAPYPGGQLFANYSAIVTSPVTGTMELRLSRAQTSTLSGKAGVWDLRQTDSSGLVTYQFGGKVVVLPTVTRP